MANPVGESDSGALRLDFDRRLTLQFRGCAVTSDAGLLAYRELDDALGLTALAGEMLADTRTGKNDRHALVGLLRQSVFGRLAGYEDVNDAERLRYDPAMRWIVGGKAAQGCGASPSQMGRFETRWLAADTNLSPLTDLCGDWIDLVHSRTPPRGIVLDMDSSVSPTHGVRCSCSTSSAIWNAAICDPATCTAPMAGTTCSSRSSCAIAAGSGASISGPMPPSPCRVSTSTWRLSTSNTRSGCPPTKSCRTGSATAQTTGRTAPVGRPPNEVRRYYPNFTYQAANWSKPRRVIAKVEWHPGELYPRVGFVVTNMSRPAERVVAFYNKRGTAEQWIKEGKGAIKWTRLSCRTFAANAVRPQLHALAYNLGDFLRTLATPEPIKDWSLSSLKEKLIKIGAKVVSHGRYVVFQMAEVAIPRQMFQEILRLIAELRPQPPPAVA